MLYIIVGLVAWIMACYLYKKQILNRKTIIILLITIGAVVLLRFGQVIPAVAAVLFPIVLRILQLVIRNVGILNIFNYFSRVRSEDGRYRGVMSKEKAYKILGLNKGATKEEVKKQYRKLMKHNHPDTGGSKYLSSLINAAKDKLS